MYEDERAGQQTEAEGTGTAYPLHAMGVQTVNGTARQYAFPRARVHRGPHESTDARVDWVPDWLCDVCRWLTDDPGVSARIRRRTLNRGCFFLARKRRTVADDAKYHHRRATVVGDAVGQGGAFLGRDARPKGTV